jgi:GT2 family glycosyltransferase
MKSINKIAVLLTCHNRRNDTLNCLKNLFKQDLPHDYDLDVYLVDDGSSDGTGVAVKDRFPKVNVIQGTGDLFWCGGMRLAWESAVKNDNYDFYLWLNDDTILYDGSVETMIFNSEEKNHQAIICGTTASEKDGKLTYGGRVIGNPEILEPSENLKECNIINGNFVLIPEMVYLEVGGLDPAFPHAIGDNDYGLRAVKKGIKIFVASKVIGKCEKNDAIPKWRSPRESFINRIKYLYSPLGMNPPAFFRYEIRHFSLFQAVKHFIYSHIKLLFPLRTKHE